MVGEGTVRLRRASRCAPAGRRAPRRRSCRRRLIFAVTATVTGLLSTVPSIRNQSTSFPRDGLEALGGLHDLAREDVPPLLAVGEHVDSGALLERNRLVDGPGPRGA